MDNQKRRIALVGSTVAEPGGAAAPELVQLVRPGTTLVAYPSRVATFPYTALERLLQEVGHADAAFAAVEDGCAASVIDSVGDYGLAAMRASLPIPAFGAGECGMAAAAAGGRSFVIITVWPESMNFIVEDRLRAYGQAEACRGIINVGMESDLAGLGGTTAYLSRIRRGHASIVDRVTSAIADAASDGAEAVLLGCTCMSPLAATLAASTTVPVVNPLAEAVIAASAAEPLGPLELRDGCRDMLRSMVDAVAGEPADSCPVCITGADT